MDVPGGPGDDGRVKLVRVFETMLKQRRLGVVIRLELSTGMPDHLRRMIVRELKVDSETLLAAAWFAAYSVDTRGPDWAPADDHLLAGFSLDELLPGLR